MLSIQAISDDVHPFALGSMQLSDQDKYSNILPPRNTYMMYIESSCCFYQIVRPDRKTSLFSYVFGGGSRFYCKNKGDVFHIEYSGFSGAYSRADLFKACHSFFVQSFQVLSSAGYDEHSVAIDLLLSAEYFKS